MFAIPMVILGVLIGLLRPFMLVCTFNKHFSTSYQALAHIYVATVFLCWMFSDSYVNCLFFGNPAIWKWVFWALVAVETVCGIVIPVADKFFRFDIG